MSGTFILLGVLALLIIITISIYNKLIAKRNLMKEAWSGIEVFLKKRYDLIPNLVETVKGYAGHEKQLLEEVTALRSNAIKSSTPAEQINSEKILTQALGRLMVAVEAYPELKANENFKELQQQLSSIESELEMARRYYNGTVRENNNSVESFPGNIVAGAFKFEKGIFYEIENAAHREAPKVSF